MKIYPIIESYQRDGYDELMDNIAYTSRHTAYRIMCQRARSIFKEQNDGEYFDLEYHPEWGAVLIFDSKRGTRQLYAEFKLGEMELITDVY